MEGDWDELDREFQDAADDESPLPCMGPSALLSMPSEMLLHSFSFLPVIDLVNLSLAHKTLHKISSSDDLWKSHVLTRWLCSVEIESTSYKEEYELRDRMEVKQQDGSGDQGIWRLMNKAKRVILPRKDILGSMASEEERRIQEWKRRNPGNAQDRGSQDDASTWEHLGREGFIYVNPRSGLVHRCGLDCDVTIETEEGPTCPISGLSFGRKTEIETEEALMKAESNLDDELQLFNRGQLYIKGYYARDEEIEDLLKIS